MEITIKFNKINTIFPTKQFPINANNGETVEFVKANRPSTITIKWNDVPAEYSKQNDNAMIRRIAKIEALGYTVTEKNLDSFIRTVKLS